MVDSELAAWPHFPIVLKKNKIFALTGAPKKSSSFNLVHNNNILYT